MRRMIYIWSKVHSAPPPAAINDLNRDWRIRINSDRETLTVGNWRVQPEKESTNDANQLAGVQAGRQRADCWHTLAPTEVLLYRMALTQATSVFTAMETWQETPHLTSGAHQTRHIYPMFDQFWASVVDSGPTLVKHWIDASCLLGGGLELYFQLCNLLRIDVLNSSGIPVSKKQNVSSLLTRKD